MFEVVESGTTGERREARGKRKKSKANGAGLFFPSSRLSTITRRATVETEDRVTCHVEAKKRRRNITLKGEH